MKQYAGEGASPDSGEAAIARVLAAEHDARAEVERARAEVNRIAEEGRAAARALAERTERRVRVVAGAFERELEARLAGIDAEAASLDTPQALTSEDLAALRRAVESLARELIGSRP